MKKDTLHMICCPSCQNELTLSEENVVDNEVISGLLKCSSCGKSFSITGGVPRMVLEAEDRKTLATRWGYEWERVKDGKFETDTYYGQTEDEEVANFFKYLDIKEEDLQGKKVLDAGCGCGRLTRALGRYGAQIVGIDIASSIDRIYDYCRVEPDVDIVQADITNPPFPDASFDYISSKLVLCYLSRPEQTFKTLSRLVKPSGRLYISMPDKDSPAFTVRVKEILGITHRMPQSLLLYLCWGLAPALWLGRALLRRRGNSLRNNAFLLFNAWHSRFSLHTTGEIVDWFEKENFSEITVVTGMPHSVNVSGTKP